MFVTRNNWSDIVDQSMYKTSWSNQDESEFVGQLKLRISGWFDTVNLDKLDLKKEINCLIKVIRSSWSDQVNEINLISSSLSK